MEAGDRLEELRSSCLGAESEFEECLSHLARLVAPAWLLPKQLSQIGNNRPRNINGLKVRSETDQKSRWCGTLPG
jgi:hypothetical protein